MATSHLLSLNPSNPKFHSFPLCLVVEKGQENGKKENQNFSILWFMMLLSLKFEISMLFSVPAFSKQPIDLLNFRWFKID